MMTFRNFSRFFVNGAKFFKEPGCWKVNTKTLLLFSYTRNYSSSAEVENPPWREASSLIIAARLSRHDEFAKGKNLSTLISSNAWNYSSRPNATDYRVLMVKRSGLSSHMANAYVFPGGLVEVEDYSPLWWSVFGKLGVTRCELMEFSSNIKGHRPPMITNPTTLKSKSAMSNEDYLPSDIALRIAALRETFEETGILLLTNPSLETTQEATTHTLLSQNIDIQVWQKRVHDEPYAFLDLCLECHMCPDIWSLYEWWNWLTPTFIGHRRYDTMFYLCCLPRQLQVLPDEREVTKMKWVTPDAMLTDHFTNSTYLPPPQVYELSRMIPLQSFQELKDFAKKREVQGCERWLPVKSYAVDGSLSYLPGDDFYPKEPDLEGIQKPIEYNHCLDDLRASSKNLHCYEIRGSQCIVYCNITPTCGHLQPLTYKLNQPIVQSIV